MSGKASHPPCRACVQKRKAHPSLRPALPPPLTAYLGVSLLEVVDVDRVPGAERVRDSEPTDVVGVSG